MRLLSLLLLAALAAPAQDKPELVSLLGKPLFAQKDAAGAVAKADAALAADPKNLDLLLAAARARDALWQFGDAIALYSRGIALAPEDVRFHRFRGHRYISTRRFDDAVRDLEKAAALAPASFDVSYHLGLAYYLNGAFGRAAAEYGRCLAMAGSAAPAGPPLPANWRTCASIAASDEARVAITEWRYRALRRAGQDGEARRLLETVGADLAIKENEAYYRTLLLYKGLRTEAQVLDPATLSGNAFSTVGYGVANNHLLEGASAPACALFRRILQEETWPAFGYIAAEVELARRGKSACGP